MALTSAAGLYHGKSGKNNPPPHYTTPKTVMSSWPDLTALLSHFSTIMSQNLHCATRGNGSTKPFPVVTTVCEMQPSPNLELPVAHPKQHCPAQSRFYRQA